MRKLMTILTIAIVSISVAVALTGCKKKSSPPSEPSSSEHNMAAMTEEAENTDEAATGTTKAVAEEAKEAVTDQKTCPVMGGPINKDVFVEYKSKKVYFCCPGCEDEFEKNPEKYISKLPQFQE